MERYRQLSSFWVPSMDKEGVQELYPYECSQIQEGLDTNDFYRGVVTAGYAAAEFYNDLCCYKDEDIPMVCPCHQKGITGPRPPGEPCCSPEDQKLHDLTLENRLEIHLAHTEDAGADIDV